jgi:signal transduction histidine kinase
MSSFALRAGWLDRGTTFVVLLLLLMVLPAACVLWFMNEAVTAQAADARRSVMEAYRGQLHLVRSRVEARWDAHAAQLNGSGDPEQRFARLILDDMADGAILLDNNGRVAYPGRRSAGGSRVAELERAFITAESLMEGPTRRQAIDALAATLNDYARPMPPSQRITFMERLRALDRNVMLPTQAALQLSAELVDAGGLALAPGVFQQTALRDVWAFTSDDGMTVVLYRTGRIEAMMHDMLHEVTPSGILFNTFAPDEAADAEAIAAGPALPGWQLSFFESLDRLPVDDSAVKRRTMAYVAVAVSSLAAMILVGAIAGRTFRRHVRLARLKTDLVAAVSHELRTPLASMRVLVDGLLDDEEVDPKKTREYLALLATENARLTRLIDNFLTFSRLERGRHHFVFAPVQPASIVAAATEAIRERLPAHADLRVDVDADLPPVVADADALVTALINLLDNAIKYTPPDKRIVLRVRRDGAHVVFAVEDNGIGIPSREQRRIFRRFYRIDQRLTRETGGVGLGLSIVELIARAHGGTVTVRSESGAGSTFTLRLPPASQGAAA